MVNLGLNRSMSVLGASTADAVGEWIAEDHRRESDGFWFTLGARLQAAGLFLDYPQNAVGSSGLDAVAALIPNYTSTYEPFMGHYPGHVLINAGISDINDTDVDGRITKLDQIVTTLMGEPYNALPWLSSLTPADGGSNGTKPDETDPTAQPRHVPPGPAPQPAPPQRAAGDR